MKVYSVYFALEFRYKRKCKGNCGEYDYRLGGSNNKRKRKKFRTENYNPEDEPHSGIFVGLHD